jgi:hypothetical protein
MKKVRANYSEDFIKLITDEFLAISQEKFDVIRLREKIKSVRKENIDSLILEMKFAKLLLTYEDAIVGIKKMAAVMDISEAIQILADEEIRLMELQLVYSKEGPSAIAREKAFERHRKDPKRQEIIFVRECWLEWQANRIAYKNVSKFSQAMLDKCLHLESQKHIEKLCRVWKAEKKLEVCTA